jgi:hypothetical protein
VGVAFTVGPSTPRRAIVLALALLPVVVYEIAPPLMRYWQVPIGVKRDIPFRETYTYFLRPRKNGEDSASRFARAALKTAAPDGLLMADSTIRNPLVFTRDAGNVEPNVAVNARHDLPAQSPTVVLTPENVRPFAERDAAYVCDDTAGYLPARWIPEYYELVPDGVIYRLAPRKGAPSSPTGSQPANDAVSSRRPQGA